MISGWISMQEAGSTPGVCVCMPSWVLFFCLPGCSACEECSVMSNYVSGWTCYAEQEQMIPAVLIGLIKRVSLFTWQFFSLCAPLLEQVSLPFSSLHLLLPLVSIIIIISVFILSLFSQVLQIGHSMCCIAEGILYQFLFLSGSNRDKISYYSYAAASV